MQATLAAARLPSRLATPLRMLLHLLLQRSDFAARMGATPAAAAESIAPTPRSLEYRCIAWVERPAGQTVTCEDGALWITFDGQQVDVVLESSQSYYCCDDARMAIYALAPSRFRLDPAR
jgi:hypothetical protein